nr:FmdB family zinc ribbon protein [Tamaricihabitans halophyticus]
MPTYTYRCRDCAGAEFDVSKPMRESDTPASCPHGHTDTVKLLPTVALAGRSGSPAPPAAAPAGGCCGGGCCG